MRPLQRTLVGSALFFLLGSAHALDGSKIFTEGGAQPAAMACVACHGADGGGVAAAGFPHLSGQHAQYTAKQLKDFREKVRYIDGDAGNKMMTDIAAKLSDKDIEALSSYIQGLH